MNNHLDLNADCRLMEVAPLHQKQNRQLIIDCATNNPNTNNGHTSIRLAPAAWMTYAWLLQHSKYNPDKTENWYYIYNNSFKREDIIRDIGYSKASISRAFDELQAKDLICAGQKGNKKVYYIPFSQTAASVHLGVLKFFIELSGVQNVDMVLRTLGTLLYAHAHGANEFTLSMLLEALDMNTGIQEKLKGLNALGLLYTLGLVSLRRVEYNWMNQTCVKYVIENITNDVTSIMHTFNNDQQQQTNTLLQSAKNTRLLAGG